MNCPVCENTALLMSERNGVEIDYCPKCRGVWLDRGELDKIIEKSIPANSSQNNPQQNYHHQNNYNSYNNGYKHKKRESWLGELFDF